MTKEDKNFEYEFDPVKYEKGGKKAQAVVWSTNSLNAAVEAIKKGLPLKANPFIGKQTKLLKPDLVYKRTEEEIKDYIKCKQDPVYFASKCYLMTPTGLQPCVLRDYQIDYLNHLKKNRFSIFLSCRQSGKSTTTAIYCLWTILFNTDKTGLILSKSGPAAADLLAKIKDMYLFLPYHLKCGTMKWNQSQISFDNNSNIGIESFSPTAGLGKTINFLILDEFAWCPASEVELFYNNIIPTITTISDSNVCIMSTQNGFNLFYKLWKAAIEHRNIYAPFKVDWYQVPQFNMETKMWEKRTEKWKEEMIGILGSEEAFYYQYGTQFSASDRCLVSRECLAKIRDKTELFEPITKIENDEIYDALFLNYKQYLHIKPGYPSTNFVDKKHCYIILVDLAEGGGGDYTVFNILEVIDKDTMEQIGYWRSNNVDIEKSAVEFWLLACQWFNNENCLISIEWNTYGALFYQLLNNLNEPDFDPDSAYRNNICQDGLDMFCIVKYVKQSIEDQSQGKIIKTSQYVPGIRFTSSSKSTACSLLKMMFERNNIILTDLVTAGELENFEDKNGNGSYKAAYGHDDIIMTFCQIPLLKQTSRYKNFIDELNILKMGNGEENNEQEIDLYSATMPNHTSIFNNFEGSLPNPFDTSLENLQTLPINNTINNSIKQYPSTFNIFTKN